MAMIAVAVQTAENQQRERQLQLLSLRNRIRGTEHLLDSLPAELQTPALRSLMIQTLRLLWTNAVKLDKSVNAQEPFQRLHDLEKEPFAPPHFPENRYTLFSDRHLAQRNRSLVRETAQLIIELKQKNLISAGAAQQQLVHLKYAYGRCDCDLVLHEADDMLTNRGANIAIHRYRTALMQLRKLNTAHQLDEQIRQLHTHIQSLELSLAPDSTAKNAVVSNS